MIEEINDELKDIEQHLDNINEMRSAVGGLTDNDLEDFLVQVGTASASLRDAYSYLMPEQEWTEKWET